MATVKVEEQTNFHPETFPVVEAEESQAAMTKAVDLRVAAVKREAPVDQGTFSASIAGTVTVSSIGVQGEINSDDNPVKVAVLESGARPGAIRSSQAIQLWASKRGMKAYVVSRAITMRGTPARRPFERAADATAAEVDSILIDQLPERIIERV